jgi:hypothetical protein
MGHPVRERIDKWDYMKLKSFCTALHFSVSINSPALLVLIFEVHSSLA